MPYDMDINKLGLIPGKPIDKATKPDTLLVGRKFYGPPTTDMKIRVRGRISAKGNLYWQIYILHPWGRNSYKHLPWGWSPKEAYKKFIASYAPHGYLPQLKPSCLSTLAQASLLSSTSAKVVPLVPHKR